MHSFLRAIGFSELKKEAELEELLAEVYRDFEHKDVAKLDNGVFIEMEKEFAADMGIKLCGVLDQSGFHRQYYFPYLKGSSITTEIPVMIEKRVDGESYAGVCEDPRLGVSLIFYLQNAASYCRESFFGDLFGRKTTTMFSGLSTNGMILLPGRKANEAAENLENGSQQNLLKRNQLMNAAKNGDPEAIESLTIEDMDLYSMVSRRIDHEDVYSIVDTFLMPYGIECDQYQIMGNILYVEKVRNKNTNEEIYQIKLECNNMEFDICINKKDLMGEPEIGRRFKGIIWMQGKVNFE